MEAAARTLVALLLLTAAAGKLRARAELPSLVRAYGVRARLARPAAAGVVAAETVIGILLLAGVAPAADAALALAAVFVAAVAVARARGARRLRCGCFGSEERPWALVLARALALAGLAALASFGGKLGMPSRDALELGGLAVLALAVGVLTVLVLALYRQVGLLAARVSPVGPLEVEDEGPPVGAEAPALSRLERRGGELVAFFSKECRLCRDLEPAVRALAREGLAVRVVAEEDEEPAFRRWGVPGTPFAVHLEDGIVAAKGLVNTLEQLDVLVTAGRERRRHATAA
ncbi:MAG: hypothetical protein ICV74_09025 [Thermoleophilia bacterium]|nr:hypothetical protein [Thermoleophilia bacterium]